jgi:hypothetical protein
MIMSLAVMTGSLAGLVRARLRKSAYQPVSLHHLWLVTAAAAPQMITFYIPGLRSKIPNPLAAWMLVSSQALLLIFSILNWKRPGMGVAGIGLGLNLAVISANSGFMPVSPQTARKLWPQAPEEAIRPGKRLGWSKDIVLTEEKTRLSWLSDRFVSSFFNSRYAFSLGDLFIALGAFWLLWELGGPNNS